AHLESRECQPALYQDRGFQAQRALPPRAARSSPPSILPDLPSTLSDRSDPQLPRSPNQSPRPPRQSRQWTRSILPERSAPYHQPPNQPNQARASNSSYPHPPA